MVLNACESPSHSTFVSEQVRNDCPNVYFLSSIGDSQNHYRIQSKKAPSRIDRESVLKR